MEVRARMGYYATEAKPLTEKRRADSMKDIMGSPLDATGLGLIVSTEPAAGRPGEFEIVVKLSLTELHLEREGNRCVALIDFAEYAPAAKKPNAMNESIKLSLTE